MLCLFATVVFSAQAVTVESQLVASGFSNPVFLVSPPGDTARQFVVEQRGKIKIIKNGSVLATPFLDITSKVQTLAPPNLDERGLLSLAFHPNYASNGFFYVFYTDL